MLLTNTLVVSESDNVKQDETKRIEDYVSLINIATAVNVSSAWTKGPGIFMGGEYYLMSYRGINS